MDAKTLLRAKKAGAVARVEHPHAAYSASGQLRCSLCAVPVKQWDAHLLTKQHRQSVQRDKAEREAGLAAAAKKKRQAEEEAARGAAKRVKVDKGGEDEAGDEDGRPALPAGFLSAGHGPSVANEADEDEDGAGPSNPAAAQGEGDPELDEFLASLNDDDDGAASATPAETKAAAGGNKRRRPAYKDTGDEGVASYSAAPQLVKPGEEEGEGGAAAGAEAAEPEPEETEAERRARVAREDKEEIMARLEEEQRAQEDADARVNALKARMDALKKRRAARGDTDEKTAKAAAVPEKTA